MRPAIHAAPSPGNGRAHHLLRCFIPLVIACSFLSHCGPHSDSTLTSSSASLSSFSSTPLSSIVTGNSSHLETKQYSKNKAILMEITSWGNPVITNKDLSGVGANRDLTYDYYLGGFNCQLKSALWIEHLLDGEQMLSKLNNKTDDYWNRYNFRNDPTLPTTCRSVVEDYSNSGFDRGHLAPANDFVTYGDDAIAHSFYTANVSPQVGAGFNRHLWFNLERALRGWAMNKGLMLVYTGPIYYENTNDTLSESSKLRFIGHNKVRVPDYFYKIVVSLADPEHPKALAFIMANVDHRLVSYADSKLHKNCQDNIKSIHNPKSKVCARDNLVNIERHQTTIEQIEKATGMIFFPTMNTSLAEQLKSSKDPVWVHESFETPEE